MLDIFDEFQLRKYVKYPCEPPIDLLHPYHDEELDILGNLNTMNLIIRGLPINVLIQLQNFEHAHTLWKDLEKRYPDYSLKNLQINFHKCIAFHKMKPLDPNFNKCLFELHDVMRAKGDVITSNNVIVKAIQMHKYEHFYSQNSDEILVSYDKDISSDNDNVEHGYYNQDEGFDIEYEKTMRNLILMANLKDYMAGVKEWVLDSGCTDRMTKDKDTFHETTPNRGPRRYATFGGKSKGKVLVLVRWPYRMIVPFKMPCLLNSMATFFFPYLDQQTLVLMCHLRNMTAKCFVVISIKQSLLVSIEVVYTLLITLKFQTPHMSYC